LKLLFGYQLLFAMDTDVQKEFSDGLVYARLTTDSPAFPLKKSDYYGLFNRSRHMGILKLIYKNITHDFDINFRTRYRSKYAIFDSNDNTYLDKYDNFIKGYLISNLSINKYIKNNFIISAGAENIFNYMDPTNIPNISGRLIYFKLKIYKN